MWKRYNKVAETEEQTEHLERCRDNPPSWRQIYSTGWRFGVISCAASTSIVFLLNLIILIWTLKTYGLGENGRQTLYHGSCGTVRKLNTVIHLVINIFSTVLLSSSNYCMQCLSAPTRTDVDRVHQSHEESTWLQIGVPSVRNLWTIGPKRVRLWTLLLFSSLPLHLFFNSAVFSSIASYSYPIVVVDEQFLTKPVNLTDIANLSHPTYRKTDWVFEGANQWVNYTALVNISSNANLVNSSAPLLRNQAISSSLQKLDVSSCISAYSQDFLTSRGALVLVLDLPADSINLSYSNATIYKMTPNWSVEDLDWCAWDEYAWICAQDGKSSCPYSLISGPPCNNRLPAIRADTTGWKPLGQDFPIKYCLSQRLPEQCNLYASFYIAILVVILNLAKALLMLMTVFGMRESPLMSIGDAVASFLERPDLTTRDLCLASRSEVRHYINTELSAHQYSEKSNRWLLAALENPDAATRDLCLTPRKEVGHGNLPRPYFGEPSYWFSAASRERWAVCLFMLVLAISVCLYLLALATRSLRDHGVTTDVPNLWRLGFGAINAATIIDWTISSTGTSGLVGNILVANLPQLILSLVYFTYNGLFTCMFLASEWDSYSQNRKGLRVSRNAVGAQRSTYFFQLPYRVAIPLMVVAGLLHWLVSQSIFLVNIEDHWWDNSNGNYSQSLNATQFVGHQQTVPAAHRISCGYSLIAILFVVLISIGLLVAAVGVGFTRFKSEMPITGSHSVLISAACHPDQEELEAGDVAHKKLQWGEVGKVLDRRGSDGTILYGVGHCSFSSKEITPPRHGALYI